MLQSPQSNPARLAPVGFLKRSIFCEVQQSAQNAISYLYNCSRRRVLLINNRFVKLALCLLVLIGGGCDVKFPTNKSRSRMPATPMVQKTLVSVEGDTVRELPPIKWGTCFTEVFVLDNNGKEPFEINSVETSPKLGLEVKSDSWIIQPGESVEVEVTVDTKKESVRGAEIGLHSDQGVVNLALRWEYISKPSIYGLKELQTEVMAGQTFLTSLDVGSARQGNRLRGEIVWDANVQLNDSLTTHFESCGESCNISIWVDEECEAEEVSGTLRIRNSDTNLSVAEIPLYLRIRNRIEVPESPVAFRKVDSDSYSTIVDLRVFDPADIDQVDLYCINADGEQRDATICALACKHTIFEVKCSRKQLESVYAIKVMGPDGFERELALAPRSDSMFVSKNSP